MNNAWAVVNLINTVTTTALSLVLIRASCATIPLCLRKLAWYRLMDGLSPCLSLYVTVIVLILWEKDLGKWSQVDVLNCKTAQVWLTWFALKPCAFFVKTMAAWGYFVVYPTTEVLTTTCTWVRLMIWIASHLLLILVVRWIAWCPRLIVLKHDPSTTKLRLLICAYLCQCFVSHCSIYHFYMVNSF